MPADATRTLARLLHRTIGRWLRLVDFARLSICSTQLLAAVQHALRHVDLTRSPHPDFVLQHLHSVAQDVHTLTWAPAPDDGRCDENGRQSQEEAPSALLLSSVVGACSRQVRGAATGDEQRGAVAGRGKGSTLPPHRA